MDTVERFARLLNRALRWPAQVTAAADSRRWHAKKISHHTLTTARLLPPPRRNDIICAMTVRDEMLRLPDALRHYREIGVDRFAVIENLSTDDTLDYLLDQQDVDVYVTTDSYAEARGTIYWTESVFMRYGWNRWNLLVDPDELLIYDGIDRHDLHDLAALLDRIKLPAFVAPLIDCYSDLPLAEVRYAAGERMSDCCEWFDGNMAWYFSEDGNSRTLRGGPRSRLLNNGTFHHASMTYPFFKMHRGYRREFVHGIHPPLPLDAPNGALLHYKFLSDFTDRVQRVIEYGQHYRGAAEYKQYAAALQAGSLANMMFPGSHRLTSYDILTDHKQISAISWPKNLNSPPRSQLKPPFIGHAASPR